MCTNISKLVEINHDCLINIISFLNFKDQLHLANTSSYMFKLYVSCCKASFQEIDLQHIEWLLNNEAAYQLEQIICHVRKFKLDCQLRETVNIPRIVDLVLTMPNLTELKLSCGFNIDERNFNKICSITNLESLTIIRGTFYGRDMYRLTKLSVLHLCNCLRLEAAFIRAYLAFANEVKVFKLIQCYIREDRIKLDDSCFNLEELHMYFLHINLNYETFASFTKLKKLSFEFVHFEALIDFSKFIKVFFKRDEMKFVKACDTEFEYQDFISFIENFENLITFMLRNAIEIPYEEIPDLDQLRNSNNMSIWFQWMSSKKMFIISLRKD